MKFSVILYRNFLFSEIILERISYDTVIMIMMMMKL